MTQKGPEEVLHRRGLSTCPKSGTIRRRRRIKHAQQIKFLTREGAHESRRAIRRSPSCLISWIQLDPEGGLSAEDGEAGFDEAGGRDAEHVR